MDFQNTPELVTLDQAQLCDQTSKPLPDASSSEFVLADANPASVENLSNPPDNAQGAIIAVGRKKAQGKEPDAIYTANAWNEIASSDDSDLYGTATPVDANVDLNVDRLDQLASILALHKTHPLVLAAYAMGTDLVSHDSKTHKSVKVMICVFFLGNGSKRLFSKRMREIAGVFDLNPKTGAIYSLRTVALIYCETSLPFQIQTACLRISLPIQRHRKAARRAQKPFF